MQDWKKTLIERLINHEIGSYDLVTKEFTLTNQHPFGPTGKDLHGDWFYSTGTYGSKGLREFRRNSALGSGRRAVEDAIQPTTHPGKPCGNIPAEKIESIVSDTNSAAADKLFGDDLSDDVFNAVRAKIAWVCAHCENHGTEAIRYVLGEHYAEIVAYVLKTYGAGGETPSNTQNQRAKFEQMIEDLGLFEKLTSSVKPGFVASSSLSQAYRKFPIELFSAHTSW